MRFQRERRDELDDAGVHEKREHSFKRSRSDADLKVCATHQAYRLVRCSILPVLSPICSDGTPILSSSVRNRFVIGVAFG